MATQELEGVLRRVDWAKGLVVIKTATLHDHTIAFDLNPRTPDYRSYVGREVKCVVEDGLVKSLDPIE